MLGGCEKTRPSRETIRLEWLTISEYRRRHLEQFQHLFVEVLRLCREAGLLKIGRLARDGTKIKANASRHKAMNYDRMTTEETRLQAEIEELLKQAQAADDADDAEHGSDKRGDELPDELARRESRRQKIREAKAALELQARDKAVAEAAVREAEGKPPAKLTRWTRYRILTRASPAAHSCPTLRGGKTRVGDTSNNDARTVSG